MPAANLDGAQPVAGPGASCCQGSFGALLLVELLKLRRSSVWVVAVLLPVLAVVSGTVNYLMNLEALTSGWQSYSSQVLIFYGLLFCSLGTALLVAASWRPEHRGTSWNAMRTTTHSPVAVALAKTLVVSVPLVAMQVVLLFASWVAGTSLGLGPVAPTSFVVGCLLTVLAAQPLVAVQSLLSMRMRSFAAPVAVCFVAVVVGVALVVQASPLAYVWPPSLVTRCLAVGSTAFKGSGGLDAATLVPLLAGALPCGVVCWGLLALVARRTGELA